MSAVHFRAALLALLTLGAAAGCSGSEGGAGALPGGCRDGELLQRVDGAWACAPAPSAPAVNALARAQLACAAGEVPLYGAGGWGCGAVSSASGGDITAISAGAGLSGGAEAGAASLSVAFEGTGSASTVARSDHTHSFFALADVPAGFLDRVDNDALGALGCAQDQLPRYDAASRAWGCFTLPPPVPQVETDPTVNSLARAAGVDACASGQVPVRSGTGWSCLSPQDRDTLAALSCAVGQVPAWSEAEARWRCSTPAPAGTPDAVASVVAGAGLQAARDGGEVSLAVAFGGSCASGKVACSDDVQPQAPTPSLAQVLAQGADAALRRIQNLGAPIASTDAVTRGYVDALAGQGAQLSVVLCCGDSCAARLPGWNCDDVGSAGTLVVPLPDRRGMVAVPNSGSPRILAAVAPSALPDGGVSPGGDRALAACTGEWKVCTQTGFTSAMLTCGVFTSSSSVNPWTCTAPPRAYVMVPGVRGMLFVDGDDASNEYLEDQGQSASPRSLIDCSAAPKLPGPGVSTGVCFR